MSTVATDAGATYLERTRPARTDALMWIAQHAHLLADGYAIGASNGPDARDTYADDIGQVSVQGKAGALASLIARFEAVRNPDRSDGAYAEWVAYDEGVQIRFVEERGVPSSS